MSVARKLVVADLSVEGLINLVKGDCKKRLYNCDETLLSN